MNNAVNPLDELGDICTKMLVSYEIYAKNKGINENELAILYALWVYGEQTQKQIADEYLVAKQTINTLCKKWETDGILISQTNPNDKREKIISLSEKGRDFAQPIIEPLLNLENQVIKQFGNERMAFLIQELNILQLELAQKLAQSDNQNE